jgi:hypothetical protein
MTHSDLLQVVYRFYPRDMNPFEPGYVDTEERQRQRGVARRAVAEYATWAALFDRLRPHYPLWNRSVRIMGTGYAEGSYDPGYSGDIFIPGRRIGFHVSLLGPYYGIRRTGAPGEAPAVLDLIREIEASYPGYEEIPSHIGNALVPAVCLEMQYFGKVTIYNAVLSQQWEESSGPWSLERSPTYVEPGTEPPDDDEPPEPAGEPPVRVSAWRPTSE